jgi:hypothetical protein
MREIEEYLTLHTNFPSTFIAIRNQYFVVTSSMFGRKLPIFYMLSHGALHGYFDRSVLTFVDVSFDPKSPFMAQAQERDSVKFFHFPDSQF